MWAVIIRELRASSRHAGTYGLRTASAAAAMTAFFWFMFARGTDNSALGQGSPMFATLHQVVFLAIWILVPLLAADCLSRERREGTLGLLFLTDLKAHEIVVAKVIARGVAALGLWVAVVPITTLPFLSGGIVWPEVALSFALCFCAICVALAAALLSSSVSRTWGGASFMALALSGFFLLLFPVIQIILLALVWDLHSTGSVALGSITRLDRPQVFALSFNTHGAWQEVFSARAPAGFRPALVWGTAVLAIGCIFLLNVAILFAGWRVRRNWQDKIKTAAQTEMERVFFTPIVLLSFFKKWMRRTLEKNPIGWVEQRRWSGRIAASCWFAIMISFSSLLLPGVRFRFGREEFGMFSALLWMLLATVAFVAAGSFRRERENGVLELLLITPLGAGEIIWGRVRGLWLQFAPAFAAWLGIILFVLSIRQMELSYGAQVLLIANATAMFFVLPVIGLYFSLFSRNVVTSWVLTLAVALLAPRVLVQAGDAFMQWIVVLITGSGLGHLPGTIHSAMQIVCVIACELMLAGALAWHLQARLNRRSFYFQQ